MTIHASTRTAERFRKISGLIKAQKIDGLLLNSVSNVSYAAGFHAPDSYALIWKNGITLITDFRYTADFRRKGRWPVTVVELKGSIFKTLCRNITRGSLQRVGFESRHLTFAECETLHDLASKTTKFIPLKETLEPLREVKDAEEVSYIKRAVQITLKAYAFIEKRLKAGLREIEAAAEIERFIRLNGASASAFDIIVASGPNSSYPHAKVSDRRMRQGEPVLIDMGVEFNGYKCDLTRTFFLGKITPIVDRAARIVRLAQREAIKIIRPGAVIKDIDSKARQFIAKKGFGENFGHALGHGVGLDVHESPSINKKNHRCLREGAVFTVEPGIYIPGSFGVRHEDMVLVTKGGVEVLSGNCRD